MLQVSHHPTTNVNSMQSAKVAGFHFSSSKVIQKGPNLLNGACTALGVTSGQQTEKGISLIKKIIIETGRNESPEEPAALLQQILS